MSRSECQHREGDELKRLEMVVKACFVASEVRRNDNEMQQNVIFAQTTYTDATERVNSRVPLRLLSVTA